jgi:hypothetical protein
MLWRRFSHLSMAVVERSLPHPIRSRERECIYYICYYAMNDRSISSPQFKRLVDEPRSRRGLRFLVQGLVLACWLNPRLDEITRSWEKETEGCYNVNVWRDKLD